MDVKDYCSSMETELMAWKAKLYDLQRKVDSMGTEGKEKILGQVGDLHNLVTEMSDRIEELRTECPTEWSPQKKAIDEATVDMRSKYEETMDQIGKASPVSIPG